MYAAYDEQLDRQVAIKVVRHEHLAFLDHGRRVMREAQALARLSHPNVVQLHETGECEQGLFLVMEYLPGVTLRAWKQAERRSWREVLARYIDAGRGLAAAHAEGMIHRDFKPENVIVGPDGRVRVLDFGLARASHFRAEAESTLVGRHHDDRVLGAALTMTGATIGTPAYMSPEQRRHQDIDARSDMYSFCVALYEALYDQRPFAGDDAHEIEETAMRGVVRAPPRRTEVPAHVFRALVRGMQLERDQRWPTMDALLAALQDDLEPPWRARLAALAAGACAFGAVAAMLVVSSEPGEADHEEHVAAYSVAREPACVCADSLGESDREPQGDTCE